MELIAANLPYDRNAVRLALPIVFQRVGLIYSVNSRTMSDKTRSSRGDGKAFLCHASSDKPKVRDLYQWLLSQGVTPWLDEVDILPGESWEREIERAVRLSSVVIVCLSPDSVGKKGYVQKEIKFALDMADQHPEGQVFIIPVRLEECIVPDRLKNRQWVDLFATDGHKRLLKTLTSLGLLGSLPTELPEAIVGTVSGASVGLRELPSSHEILDVPHIISSPVESLDELYRGTTNLSTGYIDFDSVTGGLRRGDLIVVAGRPSMAKTAFAMNVAENVAVHNGRTVLVFSLEMSRQALMKRILASHAMVDYRRLRDGSACEDDRQRIPKAAERIMRAKFFVDDAPRITVAEMRPKALRLKESQGLDLIVVDRLEVVPPASEYQPASAKTREGIAAVANGLKALATDVQTPILALSGLQKPPRSRGKDYRPRIDDLLGNGSIERQADLIALVHREEVYTDDPDLEGLAEIIVVKNRNGDTGRVRLAFLRGAVRFESLAEGNQ